MGKTVSGCQIKWHIPLYHDTKPSDRYFILSNCGYECTRGLIGIICKEYNIIS